MIAGRDKLDDARCETAVETMIETMSLVPGITAHEMAAAGLRLAHRVCLQTLECSSPGARLQNEEILRQCLQDMLMALAGPGSTVQ